MDYFKIGEADAIQRLIPYFPCPCGEAFWTIKCHIPDTWISKTIFDINMISVKCINCQYQLTRDLFDTIFTYWKDQDRSEALRNRNQGKIKPIGAEQYKELKKYRDKVIQYQAKFAHFQINTCARDTEYTPHQVPIMVNEDPMCDTDADTDLP